MKIFLQNMSSAFYPGFEKMRRQGLPLLYRVTYTKTIGFGLGKGQREADLDNERLNNIFVLS